MTGGTHFSKTDDSNAEKFAERYLFACLGMEHIMLGLADSSDSLVAVSLQDTFVE